DANREKLRARAAVLQAKTEWEQQGRRHDLLLPAGFQLERARVLLAEPGDLKIDDIQEFIALSANVQRRRVWRRRIAITGGVVSAFMLLTIFSTLFFQATLAMRERDFAMKLNRRTETFIKLLDTASGRKTLEGICEEAIEVTTTLATTS